MYISVDCKASPCGGKKMGPGQSVLGLNPCLIFTKVISPLSFPGAKWESHY